MLAQEAVEIGPEETAGEVEARLAPLGARLALEVVGRLEAGPVEGRKQDPSQVTKAPKLKKENGLIDWGRTAEQVCNQIRAMQPWPTAYTYWHRAGQEPLRLIVTRAKVSPVGFPPGYEPGNLGVAPSIPYLWVATGSNQSSSSGWLTAVEVHELQPAGKRRMTAEEFLRGRRPQPGDRLGPEAP